MAEQFIHTHTPFLRLSIFILKLLQHQNTGKMTTVHRDSHIAHYITVTDAHFYYNL